MRSNQIDLHRFDFTIVQANIGEKTDAGVESVNRSDTANCSVHFAARILHSYQGCRRYLHHLQPFGNCYHLFQRKREAIKANHQLILIKLVRNPKKDSTV